MPGPTTKITPREKAAVLMNAAGLCDDWRELFLIADEQPPEIVEKKNYLPQIISKWKQSPKIQACLKEFQKYFADRDADARRQGAEEEKRRKEEKQSQPEGSEATENQQPRRIGKELDFYDPANQKKQINKIIQETDDPKTQLDAIKAIQQTQRDDRQAAKDNQIQRFYTPLRCNDCPLMMKARRKAIK